MAAGRRKSIKKSFIILLTLAVMVVGCGSGTGKAPKQYKYPDYVNPLLQNDDLFTGSHWNDPSVLMVNGTFVMYASSDLAWDGYVKIYRLTSGDGVTWALDPVTPVLDNSPGGWDDHSVETPAVVYYQGSYHMFYTGYDVAPGYSSPGIDNTPGTSDDDIAPKHFKIGHAVSADGITFTKQGVVTEPTAPYDDPNFDFNQYVVGEPGPVVHDGKIYLYFTAYGFNNTTVNNTWQVIGLTIYNGASWDSPRAVLEPDLTLYPREQYVGYSTPSAMELNGTIQLYFDVALDPFQQVKIHHAASLDGETDWMQDNTPLIEREDASWTADEVRSPWPLLYHNKVWLYYAGHTTNPTVNLGIGLKLLPVP